MITLTTPYQILSALSGAAVAYNKIRITSVQFDLVGQGMTAQFQIVVSTDPTKPAVLGTLTISTTGGSPSAQIAVPQLSINQQFALTAAQALAVQTDMTNIQNHLENALVNQGIVAGAQSAGQ